MKLLFTDNLCLKNSFSSSTIVEKKKRRSLSFDKEEMLILEVQKREPLWNFQLDVKYRNSKVVKQLWQEVSEALNGSISPEAAKTKFKSLHDIFRKNFQSENKASGSERTRTTRWHHYQNMEFMRDSCLIKK
ncbi:hypothetical protein PUN28_008324 [Cardiocondyla obscurior]|uniref:MADF domain-containing protein n=1 Tax=Cardiocondyla obscurior TaxID=286306 RepID=A0AAW2G1W7_9HYME